MSKSSDLNKVVKRYILDSIENCDSDIAMSDSDKLHFLQERFNSEYGHEIERHGQQQALINYIMGLPSHFNIEYRYEAILELAIKWSSIPEDATERQEQKILDNWLNLISAKTLQLFRKFNSSSSRDLMNGKTTI